MTKDISLRLMMASASLVLAACSSAVSQEAVSTGGSNTAIVTQSDGRMADGGLIASLDAAPPAPPVLDGGPPPLRTPAPDAIAPEPVLPPAPAPRVIAPEPLAPPAVVRADFTCDIDVVRTANGIRITPVVRADRTLDGEYSLVITRTGAAGSSDINQGGPFDAARGERVKLGASEISFERGDTYRAVLKVRANGREICRDTRS
jgi:hypothetical protein